ncbi:hypothetical protein DFH09DRAFT_1091106 [Mycena vulgaris]|nr:hypothetical protein DFH09DRAFT_1091106 [Mycena vulgaris]
MASVPHELIAAIVDELEHDRDSLKACSLAAAAFCSPSQRHLFRSMWLHRANWQFYTAQQQALHRGTSIPSGTIRGMAAILSKSPHLASYVRDLTIDLPDSADEDIPLERVLHAVPNVERFVISGLAVRWSDLSPPLASAILDVLARPALDCLHLLNLRDVPTTAILRVLSTVRVLSIHHTTFREDEEGSRGPPSAARLQDLISAVKVLSIHHTAVRGDEGGSPRPPSARLQHLILSTSLPATFALIFSPHAPRLTNVKKLLLRVDVSGRAQTERLLSSISGTLQDLDLDCGELGLPLNLPHLPALRAITLRMFRGLARSLPEGFAHTLAALPRVTALTLVFSIQNRIAEGDWLTEGALLGLEDCQVAAIHCQLRFLDPVTMRASTRDAAFGAFCAALCAALPGFKLEFSRVDRHFGLSQRLECPGHVHEDVRIWLYAIRDGLTQRNVPQELWIGVAVSFLGDDPRAVVDGVREKMVMLNEQKGEADWDWTWDTFAEKAKKDACKDACEEDACENESRSVGENIQRFKMQHPYAATAAGLGLMTVDGITVGPAILVGTLNLLGFGASGVDGSEAP